MGPLHLGFNALWPLSRNSLIILSLNLWFLSEVCWDNEPFSGDSEPWLTHLPPSDLGEVLGCLLPVPWCLGHAFPPPPHSHPMTTVTLYVA